MSNIISPAELYAFKNKTKYLFNAFKSTDFNFVQSPTHIRIRSIAVNPIPTESCTLQCPILLFNKSYHKSLNSSSLHKLRKAYIDQIRKTTNHKAIISKQTYIANIKPHFSANSSFAKDAPIPKITSNSHNTFYSNFNMAVSSKPMLSKEKSLNITSYDLACMARRKLKLSSPKLICKQRNVFNCGIKDLILKGKEQKIKSHNSSPKSKTSFKLKFKKRMKLTKIANSKEYIQGWTDEDNRVLFSDGLLPIE